MNWVLSDELLPSSHNVDIRHRLIKALQIAYILLRATVVIDISREQIILLRPQIVGFNDLHWELIKDANIFILNLAAWGFCMVLLLRCCFENDIFSSQSDSLSTSSNVAIVPRVAFILHRVPSWLILI